MTDLAGELGRLPGRRGQAPWRGHEYVRGWGVFGLPFDTGHVLALRVFPESDFSPYRTVWHRDPAGRWSIYVDGPRLETACPRYYGPACSHTAFARITVTWSGPMSLEVTIDEPALEWSLTARETGVLRVLNALSPRMPLWTWRSRPLVRAREVMARRLLGMGDIQMAGEMPSGHKGILMPARMYFIDESTAALDGEDLGQPTVADENPRIGDVPLPARGVLAVGQAAWEILDPEEYARRRAESGTAG